MSDEPLRHLDAAIAAAERDVQAAKERLDSLLAARGKISGHAANHGQRSDADRANPREEMSLTAAIERVMLDGGKAKATDIFSKVLAMGFDTTQNTVYTTLARLKKSDRVNSDGGLWDLTSWRRKECRKIT